MSKDPAFLFYYQDFFTGISDMTNEEAGAYIRCLCIQASKCGITEKHMKNICCTNDVHEYIKTKFVFNNETQLFENTRLKEEISKRQKYSESRSNNRKGTKKDTVSINNKSKTYVKHMEDEIENEDEIKDELENKKKPKEKKENLEVIYPFNTENFIGEWLSWKIYKSKEFNFKYKSVQSEQAGLTELSNLSGKNETKAIAIINQSIAKGWKGFFELKNNTSTAQLNDSKNIIHTN